MEGDDAYHLSLAKNRQLRIAVCVTRLIGTCRTQRTVCIRLAVWGILLGRVLEQTIPSMRNKRRKGLDIVANLHRNQPSTRGVGE